MAVVAGLVFAWDRVETFGGVAFGAGAVLIDHAGVYLSAPHGPFTNFDGWLLLGFAYWFVTRVSRIVDTLSDIRELNRARVNALYRRGASSVDQ